MDEILEILEKDARTTPEEIARMTGRSPAEVKAAIRELEKKGVILKYTAIINKDLADSAVQALIEVKVTPQRGIGYDAVAERIIKFPEVLTAYLLSGTYDILVIVEGRNLQEVATFVSEKLATLDQVTGTVTHFMLKKYKEQGVIFHRKKRNKRLLVSP
ncbi:MAG: Lrp/AsnC family transcriptional regulator [Methanobacteriota archaeon]|nr:MAG: Lrp/AsnC family transcriptional regulator [Euryarchaeota archaeon]